MCATGCDLKRSILGDLQFLDVCSMCVRLPCRVGACEYGPDVLLVHQGDVFFGSAEFCVGVYVIGV